MGGSGTCKRWQMQPNSGERWQPFVYFGLGRAWAGRRKAREAASAISTRRRLWLAAGARPGLLTRIRIRDGRHRINQSKGTHRFPGCLSRHCWLRR